MFISFQRTYIGLMLELILALKVSEIFGFGVLSVPEANSGYFGYEL